MFRTDTINESSLKEILATFLDKFPKEEKYLITVYASSPYSYGINPYNGTLDMQIKALENKFNDTI